jgi:hypothetical protein
VSHTDLFGVDGDLPAGALRPAPAVSQSDLFTAAAEQTALVTGRPASAIRIDLLGALPPAPAGFSCLCGARLMRTKAGLSCPACDA